MNKKLLTKLDSEKKEKKEIGIWQGRTFAIQQKTTISTL